MTTQDFIIELFCRIDDAMREVAKHSQANLYPSEIVTLGILFALKGVGNRAFYRWLERDWKALFPQLPDRTRLFRLFKAHQDWTHRFLADPSLLGVADTYGIELLHPMREGRSPNQIGKKGKSNHRWMVGGQLAFVPCAISRRSDIASGNTFRHDWHSRWPCSTSWCSGAYDQVKMASFACPLPSSVCKSSTIR